MPVSPAIAEDRQARFNARMRQAEKIVPEGMYCYRATEITKDMSGQPIRRTKPCPYYKARSDKPEQRYGYCRLLKVGDYTQGRNADGTRRGTMLLWDRVKECGLNNDEAMDVIDNDTLAA